MWNAFTQNHKHQRKKNHYYDKINDNIQYEVSSIVEISSLSLHDAEWKIESIIFDLGFWFSTGVYFKVIKLTQSCAISKSLLSGYEWYFKCVK